VIISNPTSRRQLKPPQLEAAAGMMRAAGWDVTITATQRAEHATEVAREAAEQLVDVVVANGGDGTVNEVINGLAGSDTALGVLPGGTANVWAKEASIPKDAAKAMRIVLDGERRRIDLGVANGRHFLLMAGIGLDAAIIPRVNPWLKRRAGALAYVIAGVVTAIRTKPWDARLHVAQPPSAVQIPGNADAVDQDAIPPIAAPLYWMVAGNTRNYGGLVEIAHRALADDALLDLVLMRRGGLHLVPDGLRVFLRRHDRSPNVLYTQTARIAIETPGIPVQLDGERCMETPLLLEVAPRALTVILPRGRRSRLFGQDPPASSV
jgi:YegS/Rv2252/BmrU family lipid kinase